MGGADGFWNRALPVCVAESVAAADLSWAQLSRKVFEVDPMLCSFCGAKLEVLSFTLELGAIRRFLTSIDCESREPEPLGHSPPQDELMFESC